jgi:AcrR family transcriptional regulator
MKKTPENTEKLNRRERKKKAIKEAILRTAVSLFNKKGFENTSIKDITDKIDIAQSTFFNYYPRKESILFEIIQERLAPISYESKKILQKKLPLKKKLQNLFSICFQIFLENEPLAKSVLIENLRSKKNWGFGRDLFQGFKKDIAHLLKQGQLSGEVRDDIEAERLSNVLESVFTFYIIDCLMSKETQPLTKELLTRLDIVFGGIQKRSP